MFHPSVLVPRAASDHRSVFLYQERGVWNPSQDIRNWSLLCLPLSLWSPLIPWKSHALQRWKDSRRSMSTDSSLKPLQQSHGEHTLPRTHRVLSRPWGSGCQVSTCCFQPVPFGESKLFSHSKSITCPLLPPVLQILNFNWELFQEWIATEC